MKKLVFAIQMFGLLAMFPVVVFLEMNHATRRFPENTNPSNVVMNSEKSFVDVAEKSTDKRLDEVFKITMMTFF